jgi:hypothetical protein
MRKMWILLISSLAVKVFGQTFIADFRTREFVKKIVKIVKGLANLKYRQAVPTLSNLGCRNSRNLSNDNALISIT